MRKRSSKEHKNENNFNKNIYIGKYETPSNIINIAKRLSGTNNHYHGAIDEMRIYRKPLSPTEIEYIFHNTSPGYYVSN